MHHLQALTRLGFGDGLHKGRPRAGAPCLVGDDYSIAAFLFASSSHHPGPMEGHTQARVRLAVAGARAEMQIALTSPPSRFLVERVGRHLTPLSSPFALQYGRRHQWE